MIEKNDPYSRGILILGLDASEQELQKSFEIAAQFKLVKGFAIGRTIFATIAAQWLRQELQDEQAIKMMAQRYDKLCSIWDKARGIKA